MRWKPSFWGTIALLFGVFFAVCEVYGAYGFLYEQQGGIDYIVLMGVGIAAAVPFLPPMADVAQRRGWYVMSVCLWLALPFALVVVITSALERTSTSTDSAQSERDRIALARKVAAKAERDAEAALSTLGPVRSIGDIEADIGALKRNYLFDRSKQCTDATARDSRELCASLDRLRGERLKAEEAARLRKQLADARAELARLAKQDTQEQDSLAVRVEAFTAGLIGQEQFRLYQPLFVPILASLFSALFLTLGVRCDFHVREPTDKKTPEPESASPSKPEPAIEPTFAIEHQPVQAVQISESETVQEPAPEPVRVTVPARPRPKLAASNRQPIGSLLDFLHDGVEFESGLKIEMAEAYIGYSEWCRAHSLRPMDIAGFVDELETLCKRFGIRTRTEDDHHYLLDMQLKRMPAADELA